MGMLDLSLHATKVLHAVEGGAVVFGEQAAFDRDEWMSLWPQWAKGFFTELESNAKSMMFTLRWGCVFFPHIDEVYKARKAISDEYRAGIAGIDCVSLLCSRIPEHPAVGYAPVLFSSEQKLLRCMENLNMEPIFRGDILVITVTFLTKQSLNDQTVYQDLASRILCLPVNVQFGAQPILKAMETTKFS